MMTVFFLVLMQSGGWGAPAVVTFDEKPCVTYRAQLSRDGVLAVSVQLEPGWHTFTMDNDKRAAAKLNGKKALGADKPTELLPSANVRLTGPWKQSAPKDFSQPELRIFSWGFETEALFAAPAKWSGGDAPATVRVKAQACTPAVCKNIDLAVEVARGTEAIDLAGLVPVQ